MKCHIGVDAGSGLVHTITVTAANEHDITEAANLIREDGEVVYGDSGYLGIQKRPEIRQNEHFSNIDFRINLEMSRNVQSGNTQNLKSSAASDQAAVCACARSRYFAGGSPSGLRV